LLLNIDTATEQASVCLSDADTIFALKISNDQKNHASFIQTAIKELFNETGHTLQQIVAVAVIAGPGSYTGLRVGMATAKGLCYALQKPLILKNTLEVIALAALQEYKDTATTNLLLCPMIDARRMEVFTALYNTSLQPVMNPAAAILDENSFKEQLDTNTILFCGSGHHKFRSISNSPNASFSNVQHHAGHLAMLAATAFEQNKFANIAYCEPFYLKEFFTAKQPVRQNENLL
ncbi:MAG: tRNA (adenosine(37)-N6)-threonylcarbamoyltransferase complex dimerization subunit type 1 TsaB, partial [Panacibacter sp.]